MDPVIDHNRRLYETVAESYAARNIERHDVLAEYLRKLMIEVGRGRPLLDIGCGPGRDLNTMREAGHLAIGLDLSTRMVELAIRRSGGPSAVSCMTSLPIATASVGGIWCVASLLHLPKGSPTNSALAEFRRVCEPSAPIVVSVRKGTFEGWRAAQYPEAVGPGRYFSDYEFSELDEVLGASSFKVVEHCELRLRERSWLIAFGEAI